MAPSWTVDDAGGTRAAVGAVAGAVAGEVAGAVTGPVTGEVAGAVTGAVAGAWHEAITTSERIARTLERIRGRSFM